MATFFLDDLNGSTISGKSADVNFPTAQTWVNVDAELDGAGNLGPDGSVVDGAFGSATYGPLTSTNVGVALAASSGPYSGSNGLDLRIEFVTPSVVQDAMNDQYIFLCGMYQNGQYIFGRAMLLAGDPLGTVRVRIYTSSSQTDRTITGVLPNTKYVAVVRTTSSGTHEMTVFETTFTCARTITGSNGVHRVSAGAGLAGKVASVRVTDMSYSATSRISAPSAFVAAGAATPSETGTAILMAPLPALFAGYGPSYALLRAPLPSVFAGGGGIVQVAPEMAFVLSTGGPVGLLNTLKAPFGMLAAFGGGNAKLAAPAATLPASATGTGWASALLEPSMPTLAASGKVSAVASATLKSPSGAAIGYFGGVVSVSVAGKPSINASGTAGAVGVATLTVPLFELSIGATAQNYGSAILAAPSARMATSGAAWILAPGAQLTAIGSAVVAASYEAYALNLKHSDPESPDELTHYTNYPFDKIVRYQNSYFGVNATGLYLLEGTTDNGAPIPWSYRTHLTDFKSVQLKNIDTIYFGGRLGPAASVSVHVGEAGAQSYTYATPRGIVAQNHRQTTGKGMRSRYYAVGASGSGEMTLDSLTINVTNLARKV